MNTLKIRSNLRNVLVLSMLSAPAVADPMIVLDHNAKAGPMQTALVHCVKAARNNPEFGRGLMFSTRMGVSEASAQGSRTFILNGTAWDGDARVPVTARCVTSPSGQTVASIARVYDERVAKAH